MMKRLALLCIFYATSWSSRMSAECNNLFAQQFMGTVTPEQLKECISQSSPNNMLSKGCDALYAQYMDTILTQSMGVATPEKLKEYKKFMLAIKLRNDMLFKITPFEQSLKSEDLALLRTPLTNYTACRSQVGVAFGYDYQTVNPSKRILSPCETSYAAQMQNTLNSLRNTTSPAKLKRFETFMLFLKYYADLGFIVKEFERKTAYVVRTRLREPLVKYITCRDSLLLLQGKLLPQ